MTVLVTGATGNVGSHAVRELHERGEHVRAFVRDPAKAATMLGADVELAQGDFEDPRSISAALAGVDRVFLSSADGPRKVEHEAAVIDAAAVAGVALIVKASALAAQPRSPLPPLDWNGRSEAHLKRSGVPAVILGSGFYMTNLLAPGAFTAPAGSGRIGMIDPRDTAAVGAVALTTDGHAGATYRLTGPEAITYEQAAAELGAEYVNVPPEVAEQGLTAAGLPAWLVTHLIGMFELIRSDAFAETTDTVRTVTGSPPRSIADFARDLPLLAGSSAAR
jgi:uncharacterized protein YbjT (DUF2867 family)